MCVPVHTQRTCDSYFNALHCTSVCIVRMCVPVHTQRTCDSYFNALHCTSVCIVCVFQYIHRGRVIAILMLFIARVFV